MQLAVTRDTDPVLVDPKREFLINGSGEVSTRAYA